MLLPILFILRPDFLHVDGEACVPFLSLLSFGHAGKFRHKIPVIVNSRKWDNTADAKCVGSFVEPLIGAHHEVAETQFVADLRLQIVREPLVDQHLVITHGVWNNGTADGRHH